VRLALAGSPALAAGAIPLPFTYHDVGARLDDDLTIAKALAGDDVASSNG
jgi:hypothetical protein